VGLPRIPILCPILVTPKPSAGTSTTKHERRRRRSASGFVTAKTVMRSATDPWLMNRFEPVRT
jgi:hypothetical protein